MAEKLTRAQRIDDANRLIKHISDLGRRFFYDARHNRVARFEQSIDGKLWFRDDYTDRRVYVAYRGRWRWFSHGGTLQALVEALANYIRNGKPIRAGHLGPWPEHYCDGDLWGYGKENMVALRAAAAGCDCVAWPVAGRAALNQTDGGA